MPLTTPEWIGLAVTVLFLLVVGRWLAIAASTLRAVAFVPLVARALSKHLGAYHYDEEGMLRADAASDAWVRRRREGLDRLAAVLRARYSTSIAWGDTIRDSFSDLRFTDASRVPFPFVRVMRDKFSVCSVVTASRGPHLQNLDGHWTIDVSGSYGVNVAGFDRYKAWIDRGWERVRDLGPVLGPLHPIVGDNIAMLRQVSGLDEVSFHMSGTEAVMAAVRMARFSTRRKLVVCFSGAYHGWWDGVQPGLGSERTIDDCLTLKDLHPASLAAIRRRSREIAAVLVNPIQAFHPNSPPPNDAVLLTSDARKTQESTTRYARWLRRLREACTAHDVPLVFDEVYTGFRLAPRGAQAYFDIQADMVVYGKTVGGGLPIGVVCGRSALMRRADPDRPMRMAYVVGTFSAHPAVMGAMNEFLRWSIELGTAAAYDDMNAACTAWVRETNARLAEEALPVRLVNLGTIWTVLFTETSRYNWLLQYYLRAEGITLSWVGTGRCVSSMDFTAEDYAALQSKLLGAARQMRSDGWWLTASEHPEKEKRMRQRLVREIVGGLVPVPRPLQTFYSAVKQRKEDDHHASHNNWMNQYLHLVSSSIFIYCYAILLVNLTQAMFLGLASLFVRQFGHAVLEPACHEEEALLLGYNTRNKTLIVLGYTLIPIALMARAGAWSVSGFVSLADQIALMWFGWTAAVVFGRVLFLTWKHDFGIAMIWFVKLVTDPFTDIVAYFPRRTERA
jgi:glutamate-1-semialdehyde 2,1-aminomutase